MFDNNMAKLPQDISHFVIAIKAEALTVDGHNRMEDFTRRVDAAGGRLPGKNRVNPFEISAGTEFDIADYLDSNEMIAEYLNSVLEEGNDSEIVTAIGHIAKAIGMTKIAEETGMSRPSLYKALSDGAKPQFSTIMKVLKAVGGQIRIDPIPA